MEAVPMNLILLGLLVLGFSFSCVHAQSPPSQLPALFIFGDSLVDPGNNNYLPFTIARSNFPNNGIDFKDGATGRFCNGRTVVDVVCDLIGTPYPPPYLAPATKAGNDILRGVNYASAAGGILDASGANYIQRIGMNQQITFFKNTSLQLQSQIGADQTTTLLNKAIVSIIIGNNDFINNYFLLSTDTKYQYNVREFNVLLLDTLNQQMTELYNLGFRKFIVSNLGPIGCLPAQLAMARTPDCIVSINDQIQDYNLGLVSLLRQLNANLPGSTFLYANVYNSVIELVTNPAAHGFQFNNQGCCGSGLYNGQVPCLPIGNLCKDRSIYVFWDPYHPTEATNIFLGNNLYNGGTDVISPINVKQLIDL